MIRAHVGSGTVYLNGWVNVDLQASGAVLAREFPELVQKWETSDEDYYGRMDDDRRRCVMENRPVDHSGMVCDAYGSWMGLPFDSGTVAEILSRQVFEHLSMTEASAAVAEAHRVLVRGGVLRLDVPDIDESLRIYRETGDNFIKRHILGSRKNAFAYHCLGWTREGLSAFVESRGFRMVAEELPLVGRLYPAFCLRFEKT